MNVLIFMFVSYFLFLIFSNLIFLSENKLEHISILNKI